ncbi:amino acid deaminase [Agromyces larvae]|uniref:Amino acid deaminase n=1 Tax=Agromyces larvae TaxID=2929802 RepID=A0ABY4C4W1_9MICO|nr:amino acid deaminase [Agromyces larvae]UOE43780.1 amino acid deaminase [Agromyces larvae]
MSADRLAALDRAAELAGADDLPGALALLPWLVSSIALDRASGRFDAWGRSTVIDEHAGEVLRRTTFDGLHAIAGLGEDAAWPIGNAGLLHVYGYLLSTVPTPWGLKRERWLGAQLADAYGGPPERFHPWAGPGTLLERVTADASKLLSRADARRRTRRVDGVDTVVAVSPATDAPGRPAALAYGLDDGRGIRLITTFPVASDPAAVLEEFGTSAPRLRWNAAPPATT